MVLQVRIIGRLLPQSPVILPEVRSSATNRLTPKNHSRYNRKLPVCYLLLMYVEIEVFVSTW
jgi:hypothetical protein